MAAYIPQGSPKKISEFSHHPEPVATHFNFWIKIQRKLAFFGSFFVLFFCFCHNFLPDAFFSIPFSWVIYIFPNLRIDTIIDHICNHIRPCHSGHFGHFDQYGHNSQTRNGHRNGVISVYAKIRKNADHP